MYGLVNRAIEGLVRTNFGDDAWTRICAEAGIENPSFVAMEPYDDALTYALVGAASAELNLPPEAVLETFGEFWTVYTMEEGYGDMLDLMGDTVEDFIDNLDSLHARIGGTMPQLIPPGFEREPQPDGSSILHYTTQREGLSPMVVGLVKGIAKRFDTEIEVEPLESLSDGHHRFRIRTKP